MHTYVSSILIFVFVYIAVYIFLYLSNCLSVSPSNWAYICIVYFDPCFCLYHSLYTYFSICLSLSFFNTERAYTYVSSILIYVFVLIRMILRSRNTSSICIKIFIWLFLSLPSLPPPLSPLPTSTPSLSLSQPLDLMHASVRECSSRSVYFHLFMKDEVVVYSIFLLKYTVLCTC